MSNIYLKFACKELFLDLPVLIVSPLVSAIALQFTNPTSDSLPKWAKWFDNADSLGDGLNGDHNHKDYYDGSTWYKPIFTSKIARWLWLLRNPANYFTTYILGSIFPIGQYYRAETKSIAPELKVGNNDNAGTRFTLLLDENKNPILFEYYKVIKWSSTKCIRIRAGWDIGEIGATKSGESVKVVLTCWPFTTYKGN